MTFTYKADKLTTDLTLPFAERDDFLSGTNGGVHGFDLTRAYSYPTQAAPTNGVLVRDLARDAVDGSIVKGPDDISFSGGGIGFATNNDLPCGVYMPGSLAGIQATQNFFWIGYVKLPAAGSWLKNTVGTLNAEGGVRFMVIAGSSDWPANPALEANLFQVCLLSPFAGSPYRMIWIRRGTSDGQNFDTQLQIRDDDVALGGGLGGLAQIMVWRVGAVFYGRLKTAGGTALRSFAAVALNTSDFSAKKVKMGRTGTVTDNAQTIDYKVFRGFTEDLSITGRDPQTVGDADWARVQARIAASAAANGGTSQIFV